MNKTEKIIKQLPVKYYWIVSFVLGALSMFVMLSYAQVLTTGKYIIINGDAFEQYISHIRMVYRNLLNGSNLLFSFTTSMGLSTIIPFAWHVVCPFNLLYLFFPKVDVNIITAIIMILKCGTASATFYFFSNKVLKKNNVFTFMFSVLYSMCSFTVVYGFIHYIWLDGLYMLPLIMLGVYNAVKQNKHLLLTLSYTYIFIVQFYMGYMIGIASFVFFVFLMVYYKKEFSNRQILQRIIGYLISFIGSFMASAVIWIPFAYFLLKYRVSDSSGLSLYTIRVSVLEIINNLFWGEFHADTYAPYIYCGIPCFFSAVLFFFNKKIIAKKRILLGTVLLLLVLCCVFEPFNFIMHAFDVPDGYEFRFSYIISFVLCVIGVIQSEYLSQLNWKNITATSAGMLFFYVIEIHMENLRIEETLESREKLLTNSVLFLFINGLIIAIWIAILFGYLFVQHRRSIFSLLIVLFTMTEVISNGVVCINKYDLLKEDLFYKWEKDMNDALDKIHNETDEIFYRTIVYNDIIHNSDSYFGYLGLTDFATGENEQLRNFLKNIGLHTTTRSVHGTGLTPSSAMLLSVKYSVRLYSHLITSGLEVDPQIEENSLWLPIGFMVDDTALNTVEMTTNVFENQNKVFHNLCGINGLYVEVPEGNRYEETEEIEIVDIDENGKRAIVLSDNQTAGMIIYRVKDIEGPVYIQIDAEEEILGYRVSADTRNLAGLRSDDYASISCAYSTWGAGTDHFLVTYTDEEFPGILYVNAINEYVLNEEKLEEAYESLSQDCFEVEELKSGYIKGKINVTGDRRVMFSSIPYVDGWKIYVNGEEVEPTLMLNGVFMGVTFPDTGSYVVEFKYNTPGLRIGALASIAGVLLILIQIINSRSKRIGINEKN